MNESRRINSLLSSVDSQINATEHQILSSENDDGISRDEFGRPRRFQGSLDASAILGKPGPFNDADFDELERRIGGETLFTRSLRFQKKHAQIWMKLSSGDSKEQQAVISALRQGHQQNNREDNDVEAEITRDDEFIFDDE